MPSTDMLPHVKDAAEILQERDSLIWRYMSLAKFVSMLDSGGLWFTRIDQFDDRHEGAISKPAFERGVQELLTQAPHGADPTTVEAAAMERATLIEAVSNLAVRESSLVNCWHKNPVESGAMWAIYGREGIAVRSSIGRLYDSTRGHQPTVMIQNVTYIDHDTHDMDFSEAALFKHRLYSFENEVRALMLYDIETGGPTGELVPCDLQTLVHAVHLAPRAGAMHVGVVRSLLEKYGNPDVPVVLSEADTVPDYRVRIEELVARMKSEGVAKLFRENRSAGAGHDSADR